MEKENEIEIPSFIKFEREIHSDGKKWYQRINGLLFNGYKQVLVYDKKCGFIVQRSVFVNLMDRDNVNIEDQVIPVKGIKCDFSDLKPGDWFAVARPTALYLTHADFHLKSNNDLFYHTVIDLSVEFKKYRMHELASFKDVTFYKIVPKTELFNG